MRFGLHLPYRRYSHVRAALRAADAAAAAGLQVTILSSAPPQDLHPSWDAHVVRADRVSFHDWARKCRWICWPGTPPASLVRAAKRAGAATIVLAAWDFLADLDALRLADAVVCPHPAIRKALVDITDADTLVTIPWDSGVPNIFHRTPRIQEPIRLFWPLHDGQLQRTDPNILLLIEEALDTDGTVCCVSCRLSGSGHGWPRSAYQALVSLRERFRGTGRLLVHQEREIGRSGLQTLCAASDLTVWPAEYEGFALEGLESLACGTPVLGFRIDPLTDYLVDGRNAWLVPCRQAHDHLGVPRVLAGLPELSETMMKLLQQPAEIRRRAAFCHEGLAKRRQEFFRRWRRLLAGPDAIS